MCLPILYPVLVVWHMTALWRFAWGLGVWHAVGTQQQARPVLLVQFGYQYSFRWVALFISLLFVLLLRVIVMLTTKYINFQKR